MGTEETSLLLRCSLPICQATMKAVALILALAVITGCNARAVRQTDSSPVRWEETVDRFWQYVNDLSSKADGALETIKASQFTRELDTLIADTMAELNTYRVDVEAKLAPFAQDGAGQLGQDFQLLADRLQNDMMDAKERSTQYLGELKAMVDQNTDNVRTSVNTYTRKLKKRLNKDSEEIRNTVTTYLGEVQSRASQNMDMAKEHVEPLVSQAQESAVEKLSSITSLLKNQAEGLGQQLETQAEGLKGQLESTAQDLRIVLETKIDELTELLSPYASKIREHVQTVMDQVKESTA